MADEIKEPINDVKIDLSISRSAVPEIAEKSVNLDEIENMTLLDQDGNSIRFSDLYKNQKTIVVFLRNFLCFMAKEYVDDLSLVSKKSLEEANVRLVVIGCAKHKFIRPFRRTTWYRHEMYTDPDRLIYSKIGCLEKTTQQGRLKESKHIKSGFIMGVLKSTWRGMQYRELQGDMKQQGASFIIGPGNQLHYQHIDQSPTDHTAINDLLALAGVSQVNFEKDTRVMDI